MDFYFGLRARRMTTDFFFFFFLLCHPESFIFSCSDRGDTLHPFHRLLLLDLTEQLLTALQLWVLWRKSSSAATTASLLFNHSRTGRLSSLDAFPCPDGGVLNILMGIPLKGTLLPLMLLIFPIVLTSLSISQGTHPRPSLFLIITSNS